MRSIITNGVGELIVIIVVILVVVVVVVVVVMMLWFFMQLSIYNLHTLVVTRSSYNVFT